MTSLAEYIAPAFWQFLPEQNRQAHDALFNSLYPRRGFEDLYDGLNPIDAVGVSGGFASQTDKKGRGIYPINDPYEQSRSYIGGEGFADALAADYANAPSPADMFPTTEQEIRDYFNFYGDDYGLTSRNQGGLYNEPIIRYQGRSTYDEYGNQIEKPHYYADRDVFDERNAVVDKLAEHKTQHYAYGNIEEALSDQANWQAAIDTLTGNFNDDNVYNSDAYQQARSRIYQQGLQGGALHQELRSFLPSYNASIDDQRNQVTDYYTDLRDGDYLDFSQELRNTLNGIGGEGDTREQSDRLLPGDYRIQAQEREGQNFQQVLDYIGTLNLSPGLDQFNRKLEQNIAANQNKRPVQGAAQTAYAGDLASASGYQEYVPNQEFANVFNSNSRNYSGGVS